MPIFDAMTSLKTLILNMTLVVTLSYLVSQTKLVHILKKTKQSWRELALLIGLFGTLSVIGWYFGVQYGTLTANMRYIPGIVGGLYGGPVVGVSSLLISGLFRLMDVGGERGFVTGIFMGLLAGLVGYYLKRKKLDVNTLTALYTVLAAMFLHFIIFAMAESLQTSVKTFINVSWILYLLNICGVVIFVNILQQEFRRIDHQKAMASLAIMEERDRIAKDLHDGFAQTLFFLNTKTVTLKKLISSGSKEKALGELEQVKEVIKEGFTDIRQTIFNLRTPINVDSDLVTTFKEYLEKFQFQTGINYEFNHHGENTSLSLPLEVEIHLFRIMQESLNNALKHAQANKITVDLETRADVLILSIADNGKGIEPVDSNKPSIRKKFGILNMQERAWSIGAKFQLDSKQGDGTKITVTLPISNNTLYE